MQETISEKDFVEEHPRPVKSPDQVRVFGSPEDASVADTMIGKKAEGETVIMKQEKPETPQEAWDRKMIPLNESIRAKEGIERQLSQLLKIDKEKRTPQDRKQIKALEEDMNKSSREIIAKGCIVLGKDFAKEQEKIDGQINDKLKETIDTAFGTDKVGTQQAQETLMLMANGGKLLQKRYDGIVHDPEYKLSEAQIKSLETQGQLKVIKNPLNSLTLSKEEVALCLQAGVDVNKASNRLGGGFIIDGHRFDDEQGFNNWIAEKRKEYVVEQVKERLEERKQETRIQSVDDYVLRREIEEIKKEILEKQKEIMPDKQKEEIKDAENAPVEIKVVQLKKLKTEFLNAKKIDAALASKGKKHIKTEEGKILIKSQMELARKKLSSDILRIVKEVSGRDLVSEVKKMKHLSEKEKQTWLTTETNRIYRKQVRDAKIALSPRPGQEFERGQSKLKNSDSGIDLEDFDRKRVEEEEAARRDEETRQRYEAEGKAIQDQAFEAALKEVDEAVKNRPTADWGLDGSGMENGEQDVGAENSPEVINSEDIKTEKGRIAPEVSSEQFNARKEEAYAFAKQAINELRKKQGIPEIDKKHLMTIEERGLHEKLFAEKLGELMAQQPVLETIEQAPVEENLPVPEEHQGESLDEIPIIEHGNSQSAEKKKSFWQRIQFWK